MKIPLNEFEQHIDEDILKRGLQYFKKGYVTNVEELSGGEYEAEVEGSETYTVHLTLKKGVIIEQECTCPFDWGSVCKHQVAVMFYLQQAELGIVAKKGVKPSLKNHLKPTPKKQKTIAEQVDEVLEKLSPEDVKDYIRDCCKKDKSFRDLFLVQHLSLTEKQSKELYAKQIKAIVKSAAGRHGYIDYAGARIVGKAVHEIGMTAEKEIEAGNYHVAMYIGLAMLEEMTSAINHGDDSNGDFGSGIEQAQNILFEITEQSITEQLRKELFDYCFQAFTQEKFKGWDWHFSMLDLSIELLKGDNEKQLISKALDSIKKTDDKWDYSYEKAQRMRLELIRKTESVENLQAFMLENLSNYNFRKELIIKSIDQKNYNYAIKLAMEGIIQDDSDKPGYALEWRMFLLNVYELKKDVHNTIHTARYLFLNAGRYHPEDLYRIMKKYVAAEEWNAFFNQLVADKQKSKSWSDFTSVSNMYIWEQQWENLMKLLLQYISLENIASVEKYLAKEYAPQLVGLYQQRILNYTAKYIGREHYVKACGFIRRMINLGGQNEANALVMQLRKLYPQRRALMEELERV